MTIIFGVVMSIEPCPAQKKFSFKRGKEMLKKAKAFTEPEKTVEPSKPKSEEVSKEPSSDHHSAKKRKLTPPDVEEQIRNAKSAYADNSYTEARFYVRQAIMGIELKIGYQILKKMPETVLGHAADKANDEVYSTGAGFAGMSISRSYPTDEGTIQASVANSSVLSSTAQFAVSSATMAGYDQNTKVTRYKGYKTMLEVDDYAGYKMSVPFGQSSVFILNCPICESEDQLLEIADLYDIDEFKTLLGEK